MTHPVYSLEIDEIELAALNANSPSLLQYRAEIAAGVDPLDAIHRQIERDEAALKQQEAAAFAPPPDGLRTPAQAARKLRCSIKTPNGHVASGPPPSGIPGHGKNGPRITV